LGDTHFKSNVKGYEGGRGLEVSGFSNVKCGTVTATKAVLGTGSTVTNPDFSGGSYVTLGARCVIYTKTAGVRWHSVASIASAIASMEEIIRTQISTPASPLPGCIFCNATSTGDLGGVYVRGPTAASWARAWL
jgi:hypothetical protein